MDTLFDAEPIRKAAKPSDDGLYRYELAVLIDAIVEHDPRKVFALFSGGRITA